MTTDRPKVTDEAIATSAIRNGAVIAERVAAWITARHLLAETARPLPTDVLALALWLTGNGPHDDEEDASADLSPGAPGSSLTDEPEPVEGDFGPVEVRR